MSLPGLREGCLKLLEPQVVLLLMLLLLPPCRLATAPLTSTTCSSTGHAWASTAGASRLSTKRPAGCLGSGPAAARSSQAAAVTAQRRVRQRRSRRRRIVLGREQQRLHLCQLDSSVTTITGLVIITHGWLQRGMGFCCFCVHRDLGVSIVVVWSEDTGLWHLGRTTALLP